MASDGREMVAIDYLAIGAVLLFGVPHGGLDGAVARRVGWPTTTIARIIFHFAYVMIAAVVSLIWWVFPVPSLAIFLIISAIHFGVSDIRHIMQVGKNHWLPVLAHGGLVSIAIPGFQSDAVAPIFAVLVGEEGGTFLLQVIDFLLKPYILIVCAYLAYSILEKGWIHSAFNLIILLLLAYLLAPLLSFALYFCLWHSRAHTIRIWQSISVAERRRCLQETFAYSIAAWVTAAGFFWYFQANPDNILIQLTFIGLAALTVPHMVLVDFADSKLHRLMAP